MKERKVPELFVRLMQQKLNEKGYPHWSTEAMDFLLDRLDEEREELGQAFRSLFASEANTENRQLIYEFQRECADVSNMAMMLADNAGDLSKHCPGCGRPEEFTVFCSDCGWYHLPVMALTVRAPWSDCFFLGKDIENRPRRARWSGKDVRGWVLLHVSQRFDQEALYELWSGEYGVMAERFLPENPRKYDLGKIIGAIEIVDDVGDSSSKWFAGPRGWVIGRKILFPELQRLECKGQLGFFEPDIDQDYVRRIRMMVSSEFDERWKNRGA